MPYQTHVPLQDSILRRKEVEARTGLSFMTLYRRMAVGLFPRPVNLGPKSVGWRESEVNKWVEDRPKHGSTTPSTTELGGASLADLTAEIARRTPDMLVQLEGMAAPMRVADALRWLENSVAGELEHGRLVQVAATCHAADIAQAQSSAGGTP